MKNHIISQHGTLSVPVPVTDSRASTSSTTTAVDQDPLLSATIDSVVNAVDSEEEDADDPGPDPTAGPSHTTETETETPTASGGEAPSNLKRRTLYDLFKPPKNKKAKSNEDGTARTTTIPTSTTTPPISSKKTPNSIPESFSNQGAMKEGHAKWNQITDSIVYMTAKDCLPFRHVEHTGFRKLLSTIVPLYHPPNRKKLAGLIDKKYEVLRRRMQEILDRENYLALTSDIWTEQHNLKSYISLTGHYLDAASANIKLVVLGCELLTSNHTSDYLYNVLKGILDNWKINKSQVSGMTTDGDSKICRAVTDLLGVRKHIWCFDHQEDLVVRAAIQAIPEIIELVEKVKSGVTFVRQNVNASDKLRDLQLLSGVPEAELVKLIQDVITRWNSTFDMLERVDSICHHVNAVLIEFNQLPKVIGPDEQAIIKETIILLRPFKEATTENSGEKYASGSLVIPTIWSLNAHLQATKPKLAPVMALKAKLIEEMDSRFKDVEHVRPLAISTILDPRFKRMHFESAIAISNALSVISNELKKIEEKKKKKPQQGEQVEEEVEAPTKKIKSLWIHHENKKIAEKENSGMVNLGGMPMQLRQYLDESVVDKDCNPLEEWETKLKYKYPELYQIAVQFLIIQGSSVASERMFSVTGNIVSPKRSRLKSPKIPKLLFMHSVDDSVWFM
nr:PREDICTED: zinc finger BED domain-containing protein 1 [Bemisia tabaci]